jgi:hypothetical protein
MTMADVQDDRFYAVADEKPKGLNKDDHQVALDKLAAKAAGEEYKPAAVAEVVAPEDHPAAGADTIAESQKDEPKKAPAKK